MEIETQNPDTLLKKIETEEPKKEITLQNNPSKKIIVHPVIGRDISSFARELVEELKNTNDIFFRPDSKDVVESSFSSSLMGLHLQISFSSWPLYLLRYLDLARKSRDLLYH